MLFWPAAQLAVSPEVAHRSRQNRSATAATTKAGLSCKTTRASRVVMANLSPLEPVIAHLSTSVVATLLVPLLFRPLHWQAEPFHRSLHLPRLLLPPTALIRILRRLSSSSSGGKDRGGTPNRVGEMLAVTLLTLARAGILAKMHARRRRRRGRSWRRSTFEFAAPIARTLVSHGVLRPRL